jgi:hypothetical protein
MLTLHSTSIPAPQSALSHLVLPRQCLLLYAQSSSVVVLDARSLALRNVLAFSHVFPAPSDPPAVSSISVDPNMNLVLAAAGSRIAAWALSGKDHDVWRVHSSLVLPPTHPITALHTRSGMLFTQLVLPFQ